MRFLLTAAILPATAFAKYKLAKDYSSYDFLSGFDFYNGPDPTNGHVQYKGYATANATGLTGFLLGTNGTNADNSTLPPPVYLGVDFTNVYPSNVGRPSVRVSSVDTYNHSLIIADFLHMPSSTCGLWPAFWMLGTSAPWPEAGEIDIVENVNDNDFNIMTLHTNAGVTLTNDTSLFNGTMKTSNCDINANDQDKNVGCSIKDSPDVKSYGTKFNEGNGGVFALQYTPSAIAVWFFPRDAIPADIQSNEPVPPPATNATGTAWGKPNALFRSPPSSSNTTNTTASTSTLPPPTPSIPTPNSNTTTPSLLTTHFTSLQLLLSTTFCGDWASKTWNTSTTCSTLAPTCEEYVSKTPDAFKEAYWAVQSIKVFVRDERKEDSSGGGVVKMKGMKKKHDKVLGMHDGNKRGLMLHQHRHGGLLPVAAGEVKDKVAAKRHLIYHGVTVDEEVKDKTLSEDA